MIRLFRVSIPTSVLGLLISESTLLFGCYIAACYIELNVDPDAYLRDNYGLIRIAALTAAFVLGAYLADLYAHIQVRSNVVLISRVMSILGGALICEAVIGYMNADWALPKSVVLTGSLSALVLICAWRILYSGAVLTALGSQRILFIGTGQLVFKISSQLRDRPELGLKPLGYLADEAVATALLPCLGPPRNLSSVIQTTRANRLVIAMTDRRLHLPIAELLDLRFSGLLIEEAANLYEKAFGRVCIDEIRPSHLILSSELGPRRWTVRAQSFYSMVIAVIAAIIAGPVLLLAMLLVKLTSSGPVFYRQKRVGLNGKTFWLYKLRSMNQDAEAKTGAVWAQKNDPRITPIGRFLRKSRLDELPQLLNVLKGEMTIVGPRPERPEFVCELIPSIPYYRQRHCVRPGITGWAQINHKYGDSLEHTKIKLEYDLYYIKNLSPSLDAYIIFQTVKTMLLSRGAQ